MTIVSPLPHSDKTSLALSKSKHKWSEKFMKKKKETILKNEEKRKSIEEERRLYRPRTVERPKVCDSLCVNEQIVFHPISFENKFGPRNIRCFICSKPTLKRDGSAVENVRNCTLCAAVLHETCIAEISFENEAHELNSVHIDKPDKAWWCRECSFEVISYIRNEKSCIETLRAQRLEFYSAVKLQANMLMRREKNRYQVMRTGFLRLQALARGVSDRLGFMNEVATTHRAFKIKIGEFCELWGAGSDGRTNVSCIACVVNNFNSEEDFEEYDDSDQFDEDETHLYRFETQTVQHGPSGRWNDTFMVYYSNSLVTLSFTVYERDESLLKSNFLGQATVDASNHLQIAFLCGKYQRYKISLGPLKMSPHEQGKATFRMDKVDSPGTGKIWVEIQPFSNVDSKCGELEEILSALLKGARKKWYAVLANRQLFLFSQFGDSRPKTVIPLHHGTTVEWHEKKVIKIMTIEHTWFLTCPGAQARNCWYTKIKGTYRETLYEGAREFQAQFQHSENKEIPSNNTDPDL